MAHRLAGVALITGASSGIGRATAHRFAKASCRHLLLVDRDQAGLSRTAKECNLDSSKLSLHTLDIKDDKSVKQLISEIPKVHGSLDYAVNCAGISGPIITLDNSTLEEMDEVLNINLRAQIVLNRAEAEAMLNSDSHSSTKVTKSIVNLTSITGLVGLPIVPFYSITKSGIIALTRLMADAFGPKGIRTNAVAPGFVKTPMVDVLSKEALNRIAETVPLRRNAEAEEIAKLALFLCSEDASFINGITAVVDGGITSAIHVQGVF